jgi:hypothetical protein
MYYDDESAARLLCQATHIWNESVMALGSSIRTTAWCLWLMVMASGLMTVAIPALPLAIMMGRLTFTGVYRILARISRG